jgi:hypothetical protein
VARLDVLTGVQGDRLVAILGGTDDPGGAVRHLVAHFGPGPGRRRARSWATCSPPADPPPWPWPACGRPPAWPDAPRPVRADDLLPERVLSGDPAARARLVEDVYRPLVAAGSALLETLSAYLEQAASLEAAARMLFVHPNTVRYRLRRVAEVTGYAPSESRQALALRLSLALGRLEDASPTL